MDRKYIILFFIIMNFILCTPRGKKKPTFKRLIYSNLTDGSLTIFTFLDIFTAKNLFFQDKFWRYVEPEMEEDREKYLFSYAYNSSVPVY